MDEKKVQDVSVHRGGASSQEQLHHQSVDDKTGNVSGVGGPDLHNNASINSNNNNDDDGGDDHADSRRDINNGGDHGVGPRDDRRSREEYSNADGGNREADVDMVPQDNTSAPLHHHLQQQQQQRRQSEIFAHAAVNPSSSSSLPTFASLTYSTSSSPSTTTHVPTPSSCFLSSPASLLSLSPLHSSSSSSSPSNPPIAISTAITTTTTNSNTTNTLAGLLVDPSPFTTLAPLWDNNINSSNNTNTNTSANARESVQRHPLQSFLSQSLQPLLPAPFSSSSSNHQAPRKSSDSNNNSNAHHHLEYQHQQKHQGNSDTNNGHASASPQEVVVGLDTSTTPTGVSLSLLVARDELSPFSSSSTTTTGSQAKPVEPSSSASREQNATTATSRRTQQSSIESPSSSLSNSPYPRDSTSSSTDSRRRQTWSLPSPPSRSSRSTLNDSSSPSFSTRPSSYYDNSLHLPPPSTLSPPTTASTLSSYPSSPYDAPSSAAVAAAAAFKHISPFSNISLSSMSWSSSSSPPLASRYPPTSTPMSRRGSFTPTSSSRTRPQSSSSPLSQTADLLWESSHQHHARSDSNQRSDNRFHPLYPAQQQQQPSTSGNSSMTTTMMEDRLSLHRLSPPDDMDGYSSSNTNNNNGRSRYSFTSDRSSLYDSLPPLQPHHHHSVTTVSTAAAVGVEASSSDRSRMSTSESGSQIPPPSQRVLGTASKDDSANNDNSNAPSSTLIKEHPKKWTSTESVYNRKVLSARGTPKGPLPMNVQISLLSSVLRHDPFNCPIRRTTQVWECISREQGVRARTCARRYDNIIQASIAGRERPVGTEEQIAVKKKLLDQLFVMMNQPQALVRMQKKKRYRSEEADRQLLLETIRLNPFAQKMGQVAKAWEDVRDALKMQVHARQCIRRVNRMIKPYQLRERMYHGNIPDEMKEENDELIKQVIQMMQASGQGGSLEEGEGEDDEEDVGHSNDDDDSASDSDDQDESQHNQSRSRHSSDGSRGKGDEADENSSRRVQLARHGIRKSSSAMDISISPRSPALSLVQSPRNIAMTSAVSEPECTMTTPAQKRRPRNSSQSSMGNSGYTTSNKRSLVDRSSDEMTGVIPPTTLRHHPFESEFKPQRLWGSHPYSKERSSRMNHGTHSQRPLPRSNSASQLDPHRPAKYTRSSSRELLRDSVESSQDRSMVLQSSSSSSHIRTPTSAGGGSDSRQQYHYDQQNNIYSESNFHAHASSGHQSMDGQVAISSAQQEQQQPAAQLYRAILGEFQVVQRYLGQMEDQRKRDKERQTEMGFMMDKLQFQLQQQQQSIKDLQHQLQDQHQHQYQHQHQHQYQRQQLDHRRGSQGPIHVPEQQQQQFKSLEDQQK